MSTPNFAKAHAYVMQRLEDDLPPTLFYHGIRHTRDQVLPYTKTLAESQGVSAEETLLLRTAALYHDTGFIKQYWDNEPVGVSIAEKTLPTFGYTAEHIEVVRRLILATRFPQAPKNPLEHILRDADLYNLGGEESFWIAGDRLIRERVAHSNAIPSKFQPPYSIQEWWERQCQFLENHSYFTEAALRTREKGKQRNLETIRQLLLMFQQKNGQQSKPQNPAQSICDAPY
ncbi:MAG TPA: HD domain-containing protein [Nitrospirales bacterium]|nr:HD domain-containing protein [Nitrospirales bacterium]